MRTPEEFDEIRPYDPEELPAIFEELIADPEFRAAAEQVLPEVPYEEACNRLRRCRTNLEVQQTFFYPLLHGIVDQCSDGLVLENSQSVDKRVPHTFITNHRDIVMDSAFLSISLLDNGFGNTMEIAIGDNLLIRPWIKKLVRVDKAFIVQRSVSLRQMLASSARLSRYMHYAIATKHENIWIAQREGRAKDSNDRTQDSILKMMAMGGEGSIIDRLKQLNLVPTALSYEYDPCDFLKAQEFQQKRDIEGFKKSPKDDLVNMQTGIFGYKGRICFRVAGPLNDCLEVRAVSHVIQRLEINTLLRCISGFQAHLAEGPVFQSWGLRRSKNEGRRQYHPPASHLDWRRAECQPLSRRPPAMF